MCISNHNKHLLPCYTCRAVVTGNTVAIGNTAVAATVFPREYDSSATVYPREYDRLAKVFPRE